MRHSVTLRIACTLACGVTAACSLLTNLGDLGEAGADAAVDANDATVDASADAISEAAVGVLCDAAGLVAYWPTNEGQGIAVADCKGATNGQIVGAVGWSSDSPSDGGHSLVFDGGGGMVTFPTNGAALEISEPFTISLWENIDPSTMPMNQDFAVRYTTSDPAWGVGLQATTDNVYFVTYADAAGPAVSLLSHDAFGPGQWNHVAAVFTAAHEAMLYVNGVLEASKTASGGISSATPLLLGVSGVGNTSLHGRLAKIALYARELTQAEINDIHAAR